MAEGRAITAPDDGHRDGGTPAATRGGPTRPVAASGRRRALRLGVAAVALALVAGCSPGPTATGGVTATPVATNPTPTPSPLTPIRTVSTIPDILTALADDTVDEIIVRDGTYHASGASRVRSDSLWINARYASRTRPVIVRAETTGGVTFDGGGAGNWIGLAFNGGAHDQTWQGFRFANAEPTDTGVITFGGSGDTSFGAGPHHITLRDIFVDGTIVSTGPGATDHAVYFSQSVGGAHDLLIDGLTVDGSGNLDSALHFFHSTPEEPNVRDVMVRHMLVTGTAQAVILWDSTIRDIVIEDSTITDAAMFAVRYELGGTVTLRRVRSTGSGQAGFHSSIGAKPPGVTFSDCDLD